MGEEETTSKTNVPLPKPRSPDPRPAPAEAPNVSQAPPAQLPVASGGGSDADLIAQALGGRPEAFRTLIERYQDPIYDLCFRMLGGSEDAEDVTQDVFVLLYRHLKDYKPDHKLSNWLYTIALNRCRRQLRKRKILRFLSLDFFSGGDSEEGRTIDPPADDPALDAGLEQQDRERLAEEVLKALPDSLRGPFVLRYFKRMKHRDIAEAMKLSLANVKVRLHRAKLLLLKRFGRNVARGL